MSLEIGVIIALCSAVLIGTGVTVQKHALNTMQNDALYSKSTYSRFRHKLWLAGFLMSYFGEVCGNWMGTQR